MSGFCSVVELFFASAMYSIANQQICIVQRLVAGVASIIVRYLLAFISRNGLLPSPWLYSVSLPVMTCFQHLHLVDSCAKKIRRFGEEGYNPLFKV